MLATYDRDQPSVFFRWSNAGLGTSGVWGILPVGCPIGEMQILASNLREMTQTSGKIDGGLSGAIGDVIFACLDGELEGILCWSEGRLQKQPVSLGWSFWY